MKILFEAYTPNQTEHELELKYHTYDDTLLQYRHNDGSITVIHLKRQELHELYEGNFMAEAIRKATES